MIDFNDAIWCSWSPFEYSTKMYEHMHINLMQVAYQSINQHDCIGHILKYNLQIQVYCWKYGEIEAFEISSKGRKTFDQVRYLD